MIVQFTHNDLDGVACALVAKLFFPDAIPFFCNYNNINNEIKRYKFTDKDTVIISDISFNDKSIIDILKPAQVYIADHHSTGLWMKEYFDKTEIHEGGDCGAKLLYKLLFKYVPIEVIDINIELLEQYIKEVNSWDVWSWVNEYDWSNTNIYETKPMIHNQIVKQFRGVERDYVELIYPYFRKDLHEYNSKNIDTIVIYGDSDSVIPSMNAMNTLTEESIEMTMHFLKVKEVNTKAYGKLKYLDAVNNDGIISILAWKLDQKFKGIFNGEPYDFILLHSENGTTGSTRYPREEIDLAVLCEEWGGGGHPRAAGFNYKSNKYRFK